MSKAREEPSVDMLEGRDQQCPVQISTTLTTSHAVYLVRQVA
ncbi:hypothetical protein [Methylomicrobium sp. Wu6]|nr:hypothetical protein [Methylomicrobium sp. Wu6]MEC4748625.1 hypothetical protein [Methylomicrobium sp. Wu6]